MPANIGGTPTSWCPVFAFPNARISWFMGEVRDPGSWIIQLALNAAGASSKA
ncbi:hypothetical protein AB9E31_13455 [Rhizobium leguminosarum]